MKTLTRPVDDELIDELMETTATITKSVLKLIRIIQDYRKEVPR